MRLCSICFITLNPSERCNIFHDCDKWDGLSGYNLWQYQLYCVELCKLCRLYMVYLENWRLSSVHSNNRINSGVQTVVQVREIAPGTKTRFNLYHMSVTLYAITLGYLSFGKVASGIIH